MSKSLRTDKKEEEEKRKVFMEQQKTAEIKRSKKTKFAIIFPPASEERHQEYMSYLLPVPTLGMSYSAIVLILMSSYCMLTRCFIFTANRHCSLSSAKRINTEATSRAR